MRETFFINENRLFAPVRVGQTAGYAHVDTGARHSSILQSFAGPFPKIGSRDMRGAFRAVSVPRVRLDEIVFLGETFRDLPADVLPDAVGGFDTLPFQVIMAVGCDLLLQKRLYLDFARQELTFLGDGPSEQQAYVSTGADFSAGVPLFEIALRDQTLKAIFDTGAGLCVLNQRVAGKFQGDIVEDEPLEAEDPTGARHTIATFRCSGLHVGQYTIDECQFLLIDISPIEQEANLQVDFVFGINAMIGKGWILDRQGRTIEMADRVP